METFDEIKEIYGEDAPSFDVVIHWHYQFKCGRTPVETNTMPEVLQSAIADDTNQQVEATILDDRCITIRQLVQDVKINVRYVEKVIYDHLQMEKGVFSMDYRSSQLSRSMNESSAPRLFRPCAKKS